MDIFSRFDISPRMAILLTISLVAVGFILFMGLGVITAAFVVGNWDLTSIISGDITSPQGLRIMRVLQMFQTVGIFLFPSLALAFVVSKKPFKLLGFNRIDKRLLWLSIAFMVLSLPGINLIASLNAEIPMPSWMVDMEKSAESLTKVFLITDHFGVFMLNLLMVAVLPALSEELFFRGVLQKYLCKITRNIFAGVLITSLIFSAIHLQFQGFIPRLLLGMIFGYLYVWTRTIWIPILVHFVNNGLATLAYFIIGKKIIPVESESLGGINEIWQLGVASIIASSFLLWIIWRRSSTSE